MKDIERFKFIGHALRSDGPFRPTVTIDSAGKATKSGETYLVRYPRENDEKFARRNQVAFYESPLHRASSRFVSHISKRAVTREIDSDLMKAMSEDIDLKQNAIDVFMQDFMLQARARGSMLLLVDMPDSLGASQEEQLAERKAPYWTMIDPANVSDYALDETGRFAHVTFGGTYHGGEEPVECNWYFDAEGWECKDAQSDEVLDSGQHPLGETPVLGFTESGDYPHFGAFAPIADLSKRLFNLDSELDEIIRAQTFSLLHYPVPENTSAKEMEEVAKTAGETIGTQNMILHTGAAPGFIAPPNGPAETLMKRMERIDDKIRDIGLDVSAPNQRESGLAMQMRFEKLNAELSSFSERIEDLERRAWDLSSKWLGVQATPSIAWPRDFNVADIVQELDVLDRMIENNMPDEVVRAQRKKVVTVQFDGLDESEVEELVSAIENGGSSL